MTGTRVGILTINDVRRGLWRDAECLLWALQHQPLRRHGYRPEAVSLFAISTYRALEQNPYRTRADHTKVPCPSAVSSGTLFIDWLRALDVMIVCEKLLPRTFSLAKQQGVRIVYIPNIDWADLRGSVENWVREVRKSGCEVWAKTERVAAALNTAGVTRKLVPWSIPDPVQRDRAVGASRGVTFLVNAGMGGWRNRRGIDIALEAFALARRQVEDIRLIVKSIKPLASYTPPELLETPDIEVIETMMSREELLMLHHRADGMLYPSRWEGFGLSLLEALHAGIPVIATDGWPMNELVVHEHNGLLVRTREVGTIRLAPRWECRPEALAQEMIRFARDRELRRRLTCPEPSELVSRQHRFVLWVRALLLQEPAPRVVLFQPRSKSAWRRSETYWADALQLHGYTVDQAFFETSQQERQQLLRVPHDFVLVSKASPDFLSSITTLTDRPIILWHHDLSERRKKWVQAVGPLIDLMCVPEAGLHQRVPSLYTPTLTLLPGAKVDGDRGLGRRPVAVAEPDSGPDVVFLGNANVGGHRVAVLKELSSQLAVHTYGKGWARHSVSAHKAVWSADAVAVNRRAKTVLSVSASCTTPHYTSNRLFHSCGAGACVVAEAYPGLDEHYPHDAVARFTDIQECVRLVRRLLADDAKRARMRAAAADHTWRHHTWADRVRKLLETVKELAVTRPTFSRQTAADIWDQRARRLGCRADGHIRWNEVRFQAETQAWWERLSPYVLDQCTSTERLILDFGCGTGRFAERLAGQGFGVVGVDISAEMLHMATARYAANVRLVHMQASIPLPFVSSGFDVLWICTVLQNIPDETFTSVVCELRRVVRRNGLLLLCENTEQANGRTSKAGHIVFRRPEEYLTCFPGITVVDEFVVEGERHTVLAGRLETPHE